MAVKRFIRSAFGPSMTTTEGFSSMAMLALVENEDFAWLSRQPMPTFWKQRAFVVFKALIR